MEAPMTEQNALHTDGVNCDPRSDSMLEGRPWSTNTSLTRTLAVSLAEGSLGRETKRANLENLSITARMTVTL